MADALGSVAQRHRADQYWVNGEITDTRAHQMAAAATRTGRPLIVLYFSDCNPAGHQMPISLARKLQGFKAIEFSELQFEVHPVALTAEQVREYGLPSTPLKAGEKRADKWQQAMGVEETEIDALAARRPELLREIAEKAITPFYDRTLAARVRRAEQQWREQAQQVIDGQIGGDVDQLRREAADRLAEIRAEIEQFRDEKRAEIEDLIDTVRVDVDESELPEPLVPEPVIDHDHHPEPLCDSRWDFAEQCRRLIASKAYDSNGSRS